MSSQHRGDKINFEKSLNTLIRDNVISFVRSTLQVILAHTQVWERLQKKQNQSKQAALRDSNHHSFKITTKFFAVTGAWVEVPKAVLAADRFY